MQTFDLYFYSQAYDSLHVKLDQQVRTSAVMFNFLTDKKGKKVNFEIGQIKIF